jgi:hypothetical protein
MAEFPYFHLDLYDYNEQQDLRDVRGQKKGFIPKMWLRLFKYLTILPSVTNAISEKDVKVEQYSDSFSSISFISAEYGYSRFVRNYLLLRMVDCSRPVVLTPVDSSETCHRDWAAFFEPGFIKAAVCLCISSGSTLNLRKINFQISWPSIAFLNTHTAR